MIYKLVYDVLRLTFIKFSTFATFVVLRYFFSLTSTKCLKIIRTNWFEVFLFLKQAATNPLSDCPGQLKILLGNQKFKVLCPNGQLKSKQGTECELKFCNHFVILTDVYDISFQNRLKVTPLNSTVGCMSQEGVIRFYKKHNKQFFNIIKFWVQKLGTIRQLIYSVRLPHGATSWENNNNKGWTGN